MVNIPYPTMAIVSTPAAVKVFDTIGNTIAPTDGDWTQQAYDDSAWATAVSPTITDTVDLSLFTTDYSANGYGPFTVPSAFSPWATPAGHAPPGINPTYFLRWHFTVPDETWFPFRLDAASWESGNTYKYGSVAFAYKSRAMPTVIFFQDHPDLTPDSEYVLLGTDFWTADFLIDDYWVALRIIFYQPDAVVGGTPFAWGTPVLGGSDRGALGVGDAAAHLTPIPCASGLNNIYKVVSNGLTTLMLGTDGIVYGCGDNSTGLALANGATDSDSHLSPVALPIVPGAAPFLDISLGQDCALALDQLGTVYGWGPNASGSLGLGDITPRYVPENLNNTGLLGFNHYAHAISAGKNFSAYATYQDPTVNLVRITVAGDNTYGQLGDGTTTNRTTGVNITTPVLPLVPPLNMIARQIAAGDDQMIILTSDGTTSLCGRADHGSLGFDAFTAGVGPSKIVSAIRQATTGALAQVEQAGPLTFLFTGDFFFGITNVLGDGVPYGGAGDGGFDPTLGTFQNYPPAIIWGVDSGAQSTVLITHVTGAHHGDTFLPSGLATCSGGSQNFWDAGNSQAVFAAFGYQNVVNPDDPFGPLLSDGKLYTWGYGGNGQMGSGSDALSNPAAISVNGLTSVIAATVANGIMFAIAATATGVVGAGHGRVFVIS